MSDSWSLQNAEKRFSQLLEAAGEKPQTLLKYGKRAVVVMSAEEYDRLKELERRLAPSFKQHLLNMPRDDGAFERLGTPIR